MFAFFFFFFGCFRKTIFAYLICTMNLAIHRHVINTLRCSNPIVKVIGFRFAYSELLAYSPSLSFVCLATEHHNNNNNNNNTQLLAGSWFPFFNLLQSKTFSVIQLLRKQKTTLNIRYCQKQKKKKKTKKDIHTKFYLDQEAFEVAIRLCIFSYSKVCIFLVKNFKMYRIYTNTLLFKHMLVFYLCTVWISGHTDGFKLFSSKQTGSSKKNTLESCRKNRDCRKGLRCSAYEFLGPPRPCTRMSSTCYCLPNKGPLHCPAGGNERICPKGEACAQTLGGNLFCVGCEVFETLSDRFEPISKDSCTRDGRPPPTSTLTPGRTGDLCSVVRKCASDLNCIDSGTSFECGRFSTRCTCVPKGNRVTYCNSSKICKKGEVCARNTVEGQQYCVSCDAARFFFFHTLVNPNDPKCNAALQQPQRPIPYFPESPDGYTLDTCRNQIECRDNLKCREFGAKKSCSRNSFLCVCQEPGNKFRSCKNSTECSKTRPGEVCATGPTTPLDKGPICVSHIYDQENFPNDVIVIKPFPKYGSTLTGENCTSELDCVRNLDRNLACTHPSEQFGGCAGRVGCTCQPIRRQVCESDSDCPRDEVCVNIRDAKNRFYCKAKNVLEPFEFRINKLKPTPTPTFAKHSQWLGQNCSTSDDCANSNNPNDRIVRKCIHTMERYVECDGSTASCVCKAVEFKNRKLNSVEASCKKKSECGKEELCVEYIGTVSVGRKTGFCLAKALYRNETFAEIP